MAFSLGVIRYTVAVIADVIEEVAEDVLARQDAPSKKPVAIDEEKAGEAIQVVSKSQESNSEAVPVVEPRERLASRHFLRFSYDPEDIPRLRSRLSFLDNASRKNRADAEERRKEADVRGREAADQRRDRLKAEFLKRR